MTPVDSSIVVLYFSGDDLSDLGGLPLKRNYYALVVEVLRELGASNVGIDIALTEPDREHQEYDRVLASTVRTAGNVVFGGYFRSVVDSSTVSGPSVRAGVLSGHQCERPYEELSDAMAGFGHTNLTSENRVPMLINDGRTTFLPLAAELFRRRAGAPPDAVGIENGEVVMFGRDRTYRFPVDAAGAAEINFGGDFGSLHPRSVIAFLQSVDSTGYGGRPNSNLHPLTGKTVFLGIAAEGRSPVIPSPYSDRLPSLALHAFLLDNLLRGTLIDRVSPIAGVFLALVIALPLIWIFTRKRESTALIVAASCVLALLLAGFILFVAGSMVFPMSAPIIVVFLLSTGLVMHRHRLMGTEVNRLTRQRDEVTHHLGEKELALADLERQLRTARENRTDDRIPLLSAEIEQYRKEIIQLRSEASDFDIYSGDGAKAAGRREQFHSLVYASGSPMESVVGMVMKVATSDATVLIAGESGTGKELVARAIHESSNRSEGPFIAVNCGALTETLLESELFGHERGAFTGAVRDKQGRFELADRGTIFLDEITETSEAFQVKLLRVLQEGTIERVGGMATLRVDVRVIASTNRDIRAAVAEKKLREDLYYRLNVITIDLPPLRERPGDVPVLAEHFLEQDSPETKASATVMNALKLHVWKGNVRELQSTLKRAALLARSEERPILRLKDFPPEIRAVAAETRDIEDRIVESLREKGFVRNAISDTAEELGGLSRGTVAEYFRGYCLKTFVSQNYSFEKTIDAITASTDPAHKGKTYKKLIDYLENAVEFAGNATGEESLISLSKPKYKNLPQRYHSDLDTLLGAYFRGEWRLPKTPDIPE
jgi:DNA-binding NtrC family response regulator